MITDRDLLGALIEQQHGRAVADQFDVICLGDYDVNENAVRLITKTLKSAAKRDDSIGREASALLEDANAILTDLGYVLDGIKVIERS